MPVKNKTNELKLTRVYDAPVQAVWDAWTDPAQVGEWWGPRGFTITTHSKDLKVGGHWSYTMHGPDGVDYQNKTIYLEVEPLVKLVYDHGGNDESKPLFRVTVLFSENGGKTTMSMCMTLPTVEAAEQTEKFVKKAGGHATWDRLAEYLSKKLTDKEEFVINRTFDTSIDNLFEIWTNPEHIAKWLPPVGFDMQFIKADIRSGGSSFYCMSGNSFKMYGRANYLEINKPHSIVYTQQFCDQDQNLSRHPAAPTWPATMLTTVEFTAEAPDRTRVTVTSQCYGDTTDQELTSFVDGRSSMTIGWTGSFDKLENYLA
ncbi:MAG: SRPBCC domain-containing protein [Candidatus Obscuribacter sp.]|jgi:uncharacterized protein YndB with AHSA1/START domain|nr:SRPBCC domain-containing protein [Candidatus Obscuribacter sp.]MBP6594843.1 SRPBCC domain-containing protein [Candidatus Obscuribacter sp.]MBP7576422.1 SRPBCC domain-containing protein [Candidatus Obscuribacter sp.]